ncbi:MAG: C40 family peptidase [Tychonema bourrellyi B0820]|uniref:NlpC/P60 family protein n=1 Tax=Tychonema bourrellyi FEM_GT703 TaxID=2040638 RepID=A0A2G4F573_9CYAN|nr:C40 family peptidase [Tychonema bourrellyi]MDQ2098311.1 C40 family peptidase [Tychonema bourrellyi B0820]PHX56953.1 NlpC/P60 family protein [Tychonema bourrellyi FEM_GT703]
MANYQLSDVLEYRVRSHINIYDSPKCDRLATQAAAGRHLRIVDRPLIDDERGVNFETTAVMVRLCEDDYPGWLDIRDVELLDVADTFYHREIFSEAEIRAKLPTVIDFAHQAMKQSNYYLWGGTVAPNYDCSGLMQAAFLSANIWLPRDAYQQEAFTNPISISDLEPGDLVFFGTPQKATHVGLYLGDNRYIHSSGKEQGRNGIGIDVLSEDGDKVSQIYYRQLRGCGKVVASYQSGNC